MRDSVCAYLEGSVGYTTGCSLFLSTGGEKDVFLKLIRKDSLENRQQLEEYFRRWLNGEPEEAEQEPEQPAPVATQPIWIRQQPDPIPEPATNRDSIRAQILSDRVQAYRKRGHLHGRLHQCSNETDRHLIAKEIIGLQRNEIERLNKELWMIDRGHLPMRYVRDNMSAASLQAINNCRSYINRYSRQLASETDQAKLKRIQAHITKWQEKLKSYE